MSEGKKIPMRHWSVEFTSKEVALLAFALADSTFLMKRDLSMLTYILSDRLYSREDRVKRIIELNALGDKIHKATFGGGVPISR